MTAMTTTTSQPPEIVKTTKSTTTPSASNTTTINTLNLTMTMTFHIVTLPFYLIKVRLCLLLTNHR